MFDPSVSNIDTADARMESIGHNPEQLTSPTALKTYVLDTSVLLSDPWALRKFAEHSVVLPLVVVTELEQKRHHPELGWFARQALRFLEDMRADYDRLDEPMPVNVDGGTVRVELNHQDQSNLPVALRGPENDNRILACAYNFMQEGKDTVLVTKDVPLRVKAGAVGLALHFGKTVAMSNVCFQTEQFVVRRAFPSAHPTPGAWISFRVGIIL